MWMFPVAIACGNTFVLKPSEKDPSASRRLAELTTEAGLPDGVLNVVHGDKVAVDRLLEHPDIAAVSFVGSTGPAGSRPGGAGGALGVSFCWSCRRTSPARRPGRASWSGTRRPLGTPGVRQSWWWPSPRRAWWPSPRWTVRACPGGRAAASPAGGRPRGRAAGWAGRPPGCAVRAGCRRGRPGRCGPRCPRPYQNRRGWTSTLSRRAPTRTFTAYVDLDGSRPLQLLQVDSEPGTDPRRGSDPGGIQSGTACSVLPGPPRSLAA
ncbi:Malonate-semialdehyde dehydrogenase [Streptomyces antimycoticus]